MSLQMRALRVHLVAPVEVAPMDTSLADARRRHSHAVRPVRQDRGRERAAGGAVRRRRRHRPIWCRGRHCVGACERVDARSPRLWNAEGRGECRRHGRRVVVLMTELKLSETQNNILNILFMAPRMVYCSIILITLELNVEDEYNVSIRQLRTLFTYRCQVCCLRF